MAATVERHEPAPTRRLDPAVGSARPRVDGKFLWVGNRKLHVRGVTYGTFRPDSDGHQYPPPDVVARDFGAMAASGFNAVRLYTVPPGWLLDLAQAHDLFVLVGLPWEQHVAFLSDREMCTSIESRVRESARACAGHPALLGYTVGNEVPPAVARWHGKRRIERYIRRLHHRVKEVDPGSLVTYVSFPSTEYLELPFLDFASFNVYLEREEELAAYLARLHTLTGDRPLVMAEIGLDSRRNGLDTQAATLPWQVRRAFDGGCAGAFLFAWTDEWHKRQSEGPGLDVDDWDFGLTDRERRPKPALAAVSAELARVPAVLETAAPRMSVVVCAHNAAATIRECLDGVMGLDYPSFETIVVDDGSTDATAAIAAEYPLRLISTENRGLASARNSGLDSASGEIVAYLDADAVPDLDWLTYLAHTFATTEHVAVGGPNIPPADEGRIARRVAHAPGGPVHVLVSDTEAEHLPGCNLAIRRHSLEQIGGFDDVYRAAGDDVDVCWRLQEQGLTLGFNPAAAVWHRRRSSLRAYWRQQRGYGKAEALLEARWPERYTGPGQPRWSGRVYAYARAPRSRRRRERIGYGTWGLRLFQSMYEPDPRTFDSLASSADWYLVMLALAGVSALGLDWTPLLAAVPFLALAVALHMAGAARRGVVAARAAGGDCMRERLTSGLVVTALSLMQPLARFLGRVRHGLTPWRLRGTEQMGLPRVREARTWSESWRSPEDWLLELERALRRGGGAVLRGGEWDRWDLEIRGGVLAGGRLRVLVEEHGQGRQLVRMRFTPRVSLTAVFATLAGATLAILAATSGGVVAGTVTAVLTILVTLRTLQEAGLAAGAFVRRTAVEAVPAPPAALHVVDAVPDADGT